jgi:hypothetical protein
MDAWFWILLVGVNLGHQVMGIKSESCKYSSSTLTAINCENFAVRNGKLKLANSQLVNEAGEVIQLRGISSHGIQWFPDCVTEDSIRYAVESYGINLYRIAVYPGTSDSGYESDPQSFDTFVANIISWCESLGIYVIIDWHVLNPGDPNAWLTSADPPSGLAIEFWTKMATLYRNKSFVMYEISNEPNNVDWTTVLSYHNVLIATIRAIDPLTIIIVGTTTWSQDIHLAVAQPVQQPFHVMYAFHFYAASHASLFSRLEETAPLIPLFVSEWGFSSASGDDPIDPATAKLFLDFMTGFNSSSFEAPLVLSWAVWSYADKDETSALLLPNSCQGGLWEQLSCSGSYLKSYTLDEKYGAACNNHMVDSTASISASPSVSPTLSPSTTISWTPTSAPSQPGTSSSNGSGNSSDDWLLGPTGLPLLLPLLVLLAILSFLLYCQRHRLFPPKDKSPAPPHMAPKPSRKEDIVVAEATSVEAANPIVLPGKSSPRVALAPLSVSSSNQC